MHRNLPIHSAAPRLMKLTPRIPNKPVQVSYLTRDDRQLLGRPFAPLPQVKLLHCWTLHYRPTGAAPSPIICTWT